MKTTKIKKNKSKALITRVVDEGYVVKIADAIENKMILSDLQKRMIDKMGYQIIKKKPIKDNNGKIMKDVKGNDMYEEQIIEDLSSKAYFEVAKKDEAQRKTIFKYGMPVRTADDKTINIMIECTDTKLNKSEWGTATSMKYDKWGNYDIFADQKALTKAQRNAVKDLLTFELVQKCFAAWLQAKKILMVTVTEGKILIEGEGEKGITAEEIKKEVEPLKEKTIGDNKKEMGVKAIFAQIGEINKKWKVKLDSTLVNKYYKKKYGVEHIKELTVEQMKEIWSELFNIGKDNSRTLDLYAVSQEMLKENKDEKDNKGK